MAKDCKENGRGISLTDKEMAKRFLFGGRVTYQGNHYHVIEINHSRNVYTIKRDYDVIRLGGIKASECEPYD